MYLQGTVVERIADLRSPEQTGNRYGRGNGRSVSGFCEADVRTGWELNYRKLSAEKRKWLKRIG